MPASAQAQEVLPYGLSAEALCGTSGRGNINVDGRSIGFQITRRTGEIFIGGHAYGRHCEVRVTRHTGGGGGGHSPFQGASLEESRARSGETNPGETQTGDADDGLTDDGVDTGINPISG